MVPPEMASSPGTEGALGFRVAVGIATGPAGLVGVGVAAGPVGETAVAVAVAAAFAVGVAVGSSAAPQAKANTRRGTTNAIHKDGRFPRMTNLFISVTSC